VGPFAGGTPVPADNPDEGSGGMRFAMTLIMLVEIYAIAAMSLNLLVGVSGRFSVFHAALMGVGAYTAALLAVNSGLDLLWGCVIGAFAGAAVGTGFQVATRHMDFFTFNIASFAFQMALYETMFQWRGLTGGAFGIFSVPRPIIAGISFTGLGAYFIFCTLCTALVIAVLLYVERTQFTLALRGMRDGEKALESLGRNSFALKLKVFAISGAAAGFAGGLSAGLTRSVHPSTFFVYLSVILMVYVVAGGRGNLRGSLLAVCLLMAVEQSIASIPGLATSLVGPLQRILYGAVLVLVIMYSPKGMIPEAPVLLRKSLRHLKPVSDGFAFLSRGEGPDNRPERVS
jgi:branched-chain amino acid transport system permease protein